MSDRHFVHQEDEVQLAKILKDSKPWLERNATTLIYALAAVLAIAAVFVYISRRPPANAKLSQDLLAATLENSPTPEAYRDIADDAGDTPLGLTSRLRQAELLLTEAVEGMFTNRKTAMENLDKAKTAFERLSENRNVTGSMRERVLAGLARTLETGCDGKPESIKAAVSAWENVLKEFPDSKMFKELAEDRIKKLPGQADFLAWFAAQNPAPADDLQLPQDGKGPGAVPPVPVLACQTSACPKLEPRQMLPRRLLQMLRRRKVKPRLRKLHSQKHQKPKSPRPNLPQMLRRPKSQRKKSPRLKHRLQHLLPSQSLRRTHRLRQKELQPRRLLMLLPRLRKKQANEFIGSEFRTSFRGPRCIR